MKKQLGIAAASLAGLAAGAGAGFVLTSGTTTSAAQSSPTTSPDTSAAPSQENPDQKTDRASKLQDILAPLVKNGTISQSQADAVIKALEQARIDHGGGPFPGRFRGGSGLDAAATAIGISANDLLTALRSGQTIAEVAKAHGVDTAKVIDAMVADYTKHEQDEVAAGREAQATADTEIAAAKDRITAIVNGEQPLGRGDHPPKDTTNTTG
jgi:hypothetical protein